MELIFSFGIAILGLILLFCLVQLCMYKKVEGFTDIGYTKGVWYHTWYRYYNRFTGRVSHEYWNEFEDHSGIEIKIWHRKDGFEWQLSWLLRTPDAYDLWSPYYEHTRTGFQECNDSNRNEVVTDFLLKNGVDDDP